MQKLTNQIISYHATAYTPSPPSDKTLLCNRALRQARGKSKMSSLAKQLKQLQIPGSLPSTATAKVSKRVSLLFDSKEAADVDNETVYSIGLNGLEELKVIEPAFSTFDNSLFGDTSKSLERALQSKDVNEKLDKHISKFLQYLSPYFLLKPAHKVLEWLIRRFQIHVYNVDSLVTCILPYHETNLFARVLQLLSIKDSSSKWNWLRPIQKAGVPLSKTAFLQHCISDPAFFTLICEMVREGIKLEVPPSSLRVLFTFYTSTVVGVLDMMPNVTEKFITQLLPHLLEGLKSDLPEMVASSYMITAQLCSRCSMEENLVKSLSDSICKVNFIFDYTMRVIYTNSRANRDVNKSQKMEKNNCLKYHVWSTLSLRPLKCVVPENIHTPPPTEGISL